MLAAAWLALAVFTAALSFRSLGAAAAGDTDPLTTLLVSEDFHPFLVGQIVFFELGSVFQDDGWNSGGSLTYDIDSGDVVDCTGNCLPYR